MSGVRKHRDLPIRICDLRPGDLVDLQGDKFADPNGTNPRFDCEYACVHEIKKETIACICVYFDGCAFGFPPNHIVKVGGHLPGYDEKGVA